MFTFKIALWTPTGGLSAAFLGAGLQACPRRQRASPPSADWPEAVRANKSDKCDAIYVLP